jgi:hypothetical protein
LFFCCFCVLCVFRVERVSHRTKPYGSIGSTSLPLLIALIFT